MSAYKKTNFSDYTDLKTYNAAHGGLDFVDSSGRVHAIPSINKQTYQAVPVFTGQDGFVYDYVKPNYNSLTLGSCCNSYPTINTGYPNQKDDGVKYVRRQC